MWRQCGRADLHFQCQWPRGFASKWHRLGTGLWSFHQWSWLPPLHRRKQCWLLPVLVRKRARIKHCVCHSWFCCLCWAPESYRAECESGKCLCGWTGVQRDAFAGLACKVEIAWWFSQTVAEEMPFLVFQPVAFLTPPMAVALHLWAVSAA